MRIGLVGTDSSHAEAYLGILNRGQRHAEARVTALWGSDVARTRELARQFAVPHAGTGPGDLADKVDAVIVGDRHGALHREHAMPYLVAGLPVFVDKPLACSVADAEAMLEAAAKSGAPLLSGSALRWQADTAVLESCMRGLQGPLEVAAFGTWYPDSPHGGAIFYGIHTVELALQLAGPKFEALEVEAGERPVAQFRSGDNRAILEFRPPDASGASAFGASVAGPAGRIEQQIRLGDDYLAPVLEQIIAMFTGGMSPLSPEAMLASVVLMSEIEGALGSKHRRVPFTATSGRGFRRRRRRR